MSIAKLAAALLLPIVAVMPIDGVAQALDFDKLADVLVDRLDPQAGDGVLLVAAPGRFDALILALEPRIRATGADFLGTWSVAGSGASYTPDYDGSTSDGMLNNLLPQIDASIMLPGATTEHRIYAAIQDELRAGHGRTIHFHWEGAYDLNGESVEITPEIDALYQNAVIYTDYGALAAEQQEFETAMRGSEIRVTTTAGTDIRFRIGDRPVNRQDGDASAANTEGPILIDREIELPAGAIRVAPIESTVNGRIVFPRSYWQGTLVENLRMEFARGVADPGSISADTGLDDVMAEIDDAGVAGRSFREFALGFNPCLALQSGDGGWIPYFGYGAGIVRLSLGDNSELGGNVGGGYVRWNFFADATVTLDGQPWVQQAQWDCDPGPMKPLPPDSLEGN